MLLITDKKKEIIEFDKNGDKCFVTTTDLTVKVIGKKESLISKLLEFKINGNPQTFYAQLNAFK
jgi:hypothetical protein